MKPIGWINEYDRFVRKLPEDGLHRWKPVYDYDPELVRTDERKLCAKLCEQEHDNFLRDEEPNRADGAMWCAAAIRGRTE